VLAVATEGDAEIVGQVETVLSESVVAEPSKVSVVPETAPYGPGGVPPHCRFGESVEPFGSIRKQTLWLIPSDAKCGSCSCSVPIHTGGVGPPIPRETIG